MQKQWRYFIMAILLILLALLWLNRQQFNALLRERIKAMAANEGVVIQSDDLSLAGLGISSSKTALQFLKYPFVLPVNLDAFNARIIPAYSSGKLRYAVDGQLYEGSFKSEFNLQDGQARHIEAHINAVKLNLHPQVPGFGITGGELSFNFLPTAGNSDGSESGDYTLALTGVDKPSSTTLPAGTFNLPLALKIPAIRNLDIHSQGKLVSDILNFEKFSLKCSLGEVSGSGNWKLDGKVFKIDLNVSLTAEGVNELGPYLALLSQGRLQSNSSVFQLRISGLPLRSVFTPAP